MDYKLIKENVPGFRMIDQVLYNRGFKDKLEMYHWINTTDKDICDYKTLGEEKLLKAATVLANTIKQQNNAIVIVDCDADGYTSAAILINYLYNLFPSWVENNLDWYMHDGKQHGLSDCCDYILNTNKYKLVLMPDSGSNDEEYHIKLNKANIDSICLDHHIVDKPSDYAIVINNQTSDYENKHASGAAITWQFCRYLDFMLHSDFANNELDLVALGLLSDMMDFRSIETKHLITEGLMNVNNPFIYNMWLKNKFKLGDKLTYMGCAFYITPFINAITRSGTIEEKELVFKSMLKHCAFEQVPNSKRGHKGETWNLVDEAILVCDRVKRRQTKVQDEGLKMIESMIEENNMLEHKVLLFLLDENHFVEPNLRGLIANKIMAKYQRPCAILTETIIPPWEEGPDVIYQGSMRGYSGSGVESFKDICESTGLVEYVAGHDNAAGLGIDKENIQDFLNSTDELLKNMRSTAIYNVDYIFYGSNDINPYEIIDVAKYDELWGQGMPEPLVAIEQLKVTKDMLVLMSPDKSPTLKIKLPGIDIIKFKSSQEEYDKLYSEGYVIINGVFKLNKNEWSGNVKAQLIMEDYDITEKIAWDF